MNPPYRCGKDVPASVRIIGYVDELHTIHPVEKSGEFGDVSCIGCGKRFEGNAITR